MNTGWYVGRRLLWAVVATYLALSLTFGLLAISPNAGEMEAAMQAATQGADPQEAREIYREQQGLDRPIHERYISYMTNMFTGNWGWSNSLNEPVTSAIAGALPYSIQYMLPATLLAVVAGYGIGLYSAMNQYTPTDYLGAAIAFFGISIPNFWFAILLILVFGVWVQDATLFGLSLDFLTLPTYYDTDAPMWSVQNAKQLVLPTLVVATAGIANQMRYSRAQALEYVNSEFVKVARAKGAGEWHLLIWHVLRVALVPLATILVADFIAILFAGAVIVEFIFQIPGIGMLAYNAILRNDTPLILATTLIPVFLAIVGNLLQDLAYVWLDPRIEYGDR